MSTKHTYTRPASEYPQIDLAFLHARCTECDGCLLWKMQMKNGPVTNIERRTWKVRHLVWNMVHQRSTSRGWAPMPTVCGNERCVHPDHLQLVQRNSHARGRKMSLTHRANIAAAKRARNAKIDMATARAIRESDEKLEVLAKRAGICIANAQRIKAGQAWIDYAANPFLQLMQTTA